MRLHHFAIALSLTLAHSSVFAGTGVKNGGSGYLCADGEIILAEHLLASRMSPVPIINNRDLFIRHILDKISNPVVRTLLWEQWSRFGDSTHWPVGTTSGIEVYFHEGNLEMTRFDSNGEISAKDPMNPVCEFPGYEPELCCTRVLISYFDRTENKPNRINHFYDRLTQYQKNVLELHEAVYKMAQHLGKIPTPSYDRKLEETLSAHLNSSAYTGEIPSTVVHSLVTQILSVGKLTELSDLDLLMNQYWQWANRIYP